MKYIYYLILIQLSLLTSESVSAQTRLTADEHALRPGDKTERLQMDFFYAENPGDELVWDFSTSNVASAEITTEYFGGMDSVVVEATTYGIRKYMQRDDCLFLCAYRNRLYDVEYSVPILEMAYPMQYGDTLHTSYSGRGWYCGKRAVETSGDARVSVDACGMLITPSCDTLRNTLRVYTLKTSSLWMPEPDGELSGSNRKLCIEESYKWYARGFRYPVVETISESYYDDTDPVSCRQVAFLCFPDGQQLLNDTVNMKILKEESQQNAQGGGTFHYAISVSGSVVTVRYSLDSAAHVSFIVSDVSGVVYRRSEHEGESGVEYHATIDCSGMFRGEYVLYINAGGQVYNSKIRLR